MCELFANAEKRTHRYRSGLRPRFYHNNYLQFLPSAPRLWSIHDPCSLPCYPALINPRKKRAVSNGAADRRGGALCRYGRDTAIFPHIYKLLWPWEAGTSTILLKIRCSPPLSTASHPSFLLGQARMRYRAHSHARAKPLAAPRNAAPFCFIRWWFLRRRYPITRARPGEELKCGRLLRGFAPFFRRDCAYLVLTEPSGIYREMHLDFLRVNVANERSGERSNVTPAQRYAFPYRRRWKARVPLFSHPPSYLNPI